MSNAIVETPRSIPVTTSQETRYDWPLCYEAENYVLSRIDAFLIRNSVARELGRRLLTETGSLLLDWTDHLVVPAEEEAALRAVGFMPDPLGEAPSHRRAFWHPEAMLPRILVDSGRDPAAFRPVLALRAESVADFLVTHEILRSPEGSPFSRFRQLEVAEENGARLDVVERRGYRGFIPAIHAPGELEALMQATELWRTRRRRFSDQAEGFRHTHRLLDRILDLVGRDLACHVVFTGERGYWEKRNRAAQVQKARQDRLGLGWANHDHHTFRSSRAHFVDLMRLHEKLGFVRRERFYAGEQAGWGAQVLEQPIEGIITFCDVDLLPHETEIDFSRRPLPPSSRLGTIGLWVGLHGESLLEAGLHHLECRFDFEALRQQLRSESVITMPPFSDFPFLKQAFTEGERWPVRPERAQHLLNTGLITEQQLQQFLKEGAIGSHLENLQRKGGFKGFNQKSVSAIIAATDPRAVRECDQ